MTNNSGATLRCRLQLVAGDVNRVSEERNLLWPAPCNERQWQCVRIPGAGASSNITSIRSSDHEVSHNETKQVSLLEAAA